MSYSVKNSEIQFVEIKKKQLILLELNEVNFDIVEKYLDVNARRFPSLKKLLQGPRIRTSSEQRYEQLEPWIQWVSAHTGKAYAEHSIFRLGDIVGSGVPQIFEVVERAGFKVGAISPMNAEHRLITPAYFLPDPWTRTPSDASWWMQSLAQAISQSVNENSQGRISGKSFLQLFLGLMRFARFRHYQKYLTLLHSSRSKPWLKALVLDLFLHDLHWTMFKSTKPNFSTLFLNAGAHIQHHYFFNAAPIKKKLGIKNPAWYIAEDEDPVGDVLDLYDLIVGEYFAECDADVLLATGLTQKPYNHVEFYYRLKSHADFLRRIGIKFRGVFPRMTRDFLVEFENHDQALAAQGLLASVRVDGDNFPLFGQIDNRGDNLFVTLTYPHEITPESQYVMADRRAPLLPEVSFVAIKNGMHQGSGFAFFTPGVASRAPSDGAHVASLCATILDYFGLSWSSDKSQTPVSFDTVD